MTTLETVFQARGLSKKYRLRPQRSIALGFLKRNRPRDLWALRELDVDVHAGEVLAVIGRNGAGKSTLLKLAAGVTRATSGTIAAPDRIAPLIEVGAGFHPELSGRENVEVNARLLGVGAKEIRSAFDDIVAFAQLEHAIDQPVWQYSSGMFMRLGFSVAIHTRPELLIVDEVLAVGDLPFQLRCLDRIREMRSEGVGVLFVSHNLTAVLNLADRAILLDQGVVQAEGTVADVVGRYHESLVDVPELGKLEEDGSTVGTLDVASVHVTDEHGEQPMLWQPGQRATVALRLVATEDSPEGIIGFRFVKDGAGMVARWVATEGPYIPELAAGESTEVNVTVGLNFAEGGYTLDVAVAPRATSGLMLVRNGLVRFGVGSRVGGEGIVDLMPELSILMP